MNNGLRVGAHIRLQCLLLSGKVCRHWLWLGTTLDLFGPRRQRKPESKVVRLALLNNLLYRRGKVLERTDVVGVIKLR